jgi:hypothetical protein
LGFPSVQTDEGTYLGRAMSVLNVQGMHEDENIYTMPYDHPYFAQLFLGAILSLVGFPDSPSYTAADLNSITMLYLVPRILMGLLAIADTFLIFKISEVLYDRKVAFLASLLFAASPTSWLIRRVWLEPIQLPFILLSILFVIYFGLRRPHNNEDIFPSARYILLIVSGIFLGLAIFTKVPAIAMIPLLLFLVCRNNDQKVKSMIIWLLPVVLIPLIWPVNAFIIGEFDKWWEGFLWQAAERPERPLSLALDTLLRIDGPLIIIGATGILFISIKNKDFMLILWILPLIAFLQLLGYVSYWYFIPILPAFCVGSAKLIFELCGRVLALRPQRILLFSASAIVVVIGLLSTVSLLILDVNSAYFKGVSLVLEYVISFPTSGNNDSYDVTLIGSRWAPSFSWILDYIYSTNTDYRQFQNDIFPLNSDKLILIVDRDLLRYLDSEDADTDQLEEILRDTYAIAIIERDNISEMSKTISSLLKYPNRSLVLNTAVRIMEIRANVTSPK